MAVELHRRMTDQLIRTPLREVPPKTPEVQSSTVSWIVVEDEVEVASGIKKHLKAKRCEDVRVFSRIDDALDSYRERRSDGVITDLDLELGGLGTMLASSLSSEPDRPFLIIQTTKHAQLEDDFPPEVRPFLGIDAITPKLTTEGAVWEQVQNAINHKRALMSGKVPQSA